jgi:hypothetical protein
MNWSSLTSELELDTGPTNQSHQRHDECRGGGHANAIMRGGGGVGGATGEDEFHI